MQLKEICKDIDFQLLQGSLDTEVKDIIYDSRKLVEGTMFVCMVGAVTDGHKYIPDAVEKGASVIVVERAEEAQQIPEEITVIKTESARYALARMSAAYFGYPADKLTTIGLTGTKGKTTTTYIIREVLARAGKKAGLIGTIAIIAGDETIPAKNTTPESYEIHKYMAKMVEAGCEYVVMEVSSQGFKLDRTAGILFDYGVFTNLSPDHIGPAEHKDFDEYLQCKSMLFRQCRTGIVNMDDAHTEEILKNHTCEAMTFSIAGDADGSAGETVLDKTGAVGEQAHPQADLTAFDIRFLKDGGKLGMSFKTSGVMNCRAEIHIPGYFSVYNALTTMAVCHALGIADSAILEGLAKVQVKGRVEMMEVSDDFSVIIDYAHNAVSARSVLETLRQYKPSRLIAVFGCGGNRSKVRRYDMGEVIGQLADLCILTSDNPRFEKVEDINNDIKVGLARSNGKFIEIPDREEAINYAIEHGQPGDMIIMLGKGHEDYIEIEGKKHHFSEHEVIHKIAERRKLT